MTKEIKYSLLGAIIAGVVTGLLLYYEISAFYITIAKVVYFGFTLSLLYFVIRFLSTSVDTVAEGS